jgi:transposase-like protein
MTTKKYLLIRQKKNIVAEAYSKPNNIKASARVYSVQPKQIRSWKSMLNNAMVVKPSVVVEIPLQEEVFIQRQVLVKKVLTPAALQKVLLTLKA